MGYEYELYCLPNVGEFQILRRFGDQFRTRYLADRASARVGVVDPKMIRLPVYAVSVRFL